jgi:hypothetical protein
MRTSVVRMVGYLVMLMDCQPVVVLRMIVIAVNVGVQRGDHARRGDQRRNEQQCQGAVHNDESMGQRQSRSKGTAELQYRDGSVPGEAASTVDVHVRRWPWRRSASDTSSSTYHRELEESMTHARSIVSIVLATVLATAGHGRAQQLGVMLGVLEDLPGHYAGKANLRAVRAVFRNSGGDWLPFPSNCPDANCLKTITSQYPAELTWTIASNGRSLGQVTTRAPAEIQILC